MAAGPRNENEIKKENERITDYHDEILQIEMLFQSPVISVGYKEYSVENYVDKNYFSVWKGRENCADTDAMRRGLNIDGILSNPDPTKNEVLTYLQYTLNIAELCRRRFNESGGRNYDFNIKRYTELLTSIRRILRELDYDVRYVPDKEIIYLVSRNIAADAVADNSDDVETDKIIEYNSFAVAGNMKKKRDILLSMGDTIESYSDNMAPGNVKLFSNIEFMLHNFNIRTDNRTGEDRVDYVADMSEEELERWYDEAYQMMLLRILQNENVKRMQRVEAVQAACEAQSVEELKRTLEAEGADRIITNRRVAEYEAAGENPKEERTTAADEERARQLKKRAEAAEERFAGRESAGEATGAESAVPEMVKTAGAGKTEKVKETGDRTKNIKSDRKKRTPSYRDVSDSASSVVIHIADEPEEKREIPIPEEMEDSFYDFETEKSLVAAAKEKVGENSKAEKAEKEKPTGKKAEKKAAPKKEKAAGKKKNGLLKLLGAAVLLVAAAACAFYFYINSFYKEASYISDRQVPENLNAEQLLTAEGWEPLAAAEAETIKADASAARKNADVLPMAARNVKNMLLVVLDRKENGFYGSADGIVLASVNTDTKKISFYPLRTDLYAEIPGHGIGRLGDATAYGGCPLLVKTIKDTYQIPIVNYLSTDIAGIAKIVNEVGGVPFSLADEDVVALNVKIKELAEADGADPESWYLTDSAAQEANGYQAAGSVILHQGTDDRLGKVMEGLFAKISKKDTGTSLKKILPYIAHNLPLGAVLSGVPSLAGIFSYKTETTVIPPENMLFTARGLIVPEFDAFIAYLADALNGSGAKSTESAASAAESTAAESTAAESTVSESTASGSTSSDAEIPEPKITPAAPWVLAPAA
ncbi:MAG: LCP family protein [Lachnospiraceae bacterium]|nr:LCP family protein [Lachnospiraceae bacterium]